MWMELEQANKEYRFSLKKKGITPDTAHCHVQIVIRGCRAVLRNRCIDKEIESESIFVGRDTL